MSTKLNGTYGVTFRTPLGEGAGVVVLRDGQIRGGDSAMIYQGLYVVEGEHIFGKIEVRRHSTIGNFENVFGHDEIEVNLEGKAIGEGLLDLRGKAPQAPGVEMQADLRKLAD